MAQELVYTSAERGLRPGTSGFCTVAMTRGLPPALVPRLEALGGYRPGPTGDGPVACCFWRVETAAGIAHVLSLVGPAPPDHTARTNKIATYAVLDPGELSPAGPAWMIAQDGFLRRSWKGAPAWIEAPQKAPAAGDPGPCECVAWKAACGDAGWAGAVASAFLRDQSKPIHVVYGAGTDPLPLVDEVIRLLPDWARWRATFSTYFLQPVAGTPCALRFCLDGTAAADAARQAKGFVLDLVRPMGQAPDSRHVRMARTGIDAEAAPRATGTPRAAAPKPRTIELAPDFAPPTPAARAPRTAAPLPAMQPVAVVEEDGPKPWIYAAVAGGVTLLALLVVLLVIAVQSCSSSATTAAPSPEAASKPAAPESGTAAPTPAFTVEPMRTPKPAGTNDGAVPPAAPAEDQIRLPSMRGGDDAAPAKAPAVEPPVERADASKDAPAADAPAADAPASSAPASSAPSPAPEPEPIAAASATAAPLVAPTAPRIVGLQLEDGAGAIAIRSRRQSVQQGAVGVRFASVPSLERAGACTIGGSWIEFGSSDLRATARLDAGNLVVEGIAKGAVPDALAGALGPAAASDPKQALREALARCTIECTDRTGNVVDRVQVRQGLRKDLEASEAARVLVEQVGPGPVTVVVRAPKGPPTVRQVREREAVEIDAVPGVRVHANRGTTANGMVLNAVVDRSASARTAELANEVAALQDVCIACDKLQRMTPGQQPQDLSALLQSVQRALSADERAALKLPAEASDSDPTLGLDAIRPYLMAIRDRTKPRLERLQAELSSNVGAVGGKVPQGLRAQAFDADGIMLFDGALKAAKEAKR